MHIARRSSGFLEGGDILQHLSRRASAEIIEARAEFPWLEPEGTVCVNDSSEGYSCWWTFGGLRANAMLAEGLKSLRPSGFDNLSIRFGRGLHLGSLEKAIAAARKDPPANVPIPDIDRAIEQLKFSICVPRLLAERMLNTRLSVGEAAQETLSRPLRVVDNHK